MNTPTALAECEKRAFSRRDYVRFAVVDSAIGEIKDSKLFEVFGLLLSSEEHNACYCHFYLSQHQNAKELTFRTCRHCTRQQDLETHTQITSKVIFHVRFLL